MKSKPIVSILVSLTLIGLFGTFIVHEIHRSLTLSLLTTKNKAASDPGTATEATAPPKKAGPETREASRKATSPKKGQRSTSEHQLQIKGSASKSKKTEKALSQPLAAIVPEPPLNNNPDARAIQRTIKSEQETLEVVAAMANVRKGPGTGQKIQERLKRGSTVESVSKKSMNGQTWYEVKDGPKTEGWVSSELAKIIDQPHVLLNAPIISQLPQLERGCEVTSLTMLLAQAGIEVNKMTLAKQIKTLPFEQNGYRSNPNDGFVGDIYSFKEPGLGVYHGPIAALAKKYLGSKVKDLSGKPWSAVEKQLNQGHAVWVIINSSFHKLSLTDPSWYTWKTKEGTIRVTYKEHSVLVTGYSGNTVYVNDPLSGVKNQAHNKKEFIAAWKQMGSQAVSY